MCSLCGEKSITSNAYNSSSQSESQRSIQTPPPQVAQNGTVNKTQKPSRRLSQKTIIIAVATVVVVILAVALLGMLNSNVPRSGPGRELADKYISTDCAFLDEKVDTKSGEAIYRYTRNVKYEHMEQIQTISVLFSYIDKEKGWIHSGKKITSTEESWDVAGRYLCEGWNGIYHFAMAIVKIDGNSVNVVVSDTNNGSVLYSGDVILDAEGCKLWLSDNDYDNRDWEVCIWPDDIFVFDSFMLSGSFHRVD